MREADWFFSSLTVLQSADFEMAEDDDIYRMGVMAQFSVTFELAWKALRAVLQLYGVDADTESCRKILGLDSRLGFLQNPERWFRMMEERNTCLHVYDENEANELVVLIRNRFLPAFTQLETTLQENNQRSH